MLPKSKAPKGDSTEIVDVAAIGTRIFTLPRELEPYGLQIEKSAEVIVLRRKTSHHPKGQGWRSRKTEEGLNPESSTGQAVYLPEIELGEHSLAQYEIRE